MPSLYDFLRFFRDFVAVRVGPLTLISAITAAAGMLIAYLGLTAVRRVSLEDEAKRITGIREPSVLDILQLRLNQSGIRLRLWEFVGVGLLIGALVGVLMALAGFVTIGILALPSGVLAYYQYLMFRRAREYVAFSEQLPEAMDDAIEYFAVYNDVTETIRVLSTDGPPTLRAEFAAAQSLTQRTGKTAASLIAIGQRRPETFWRQFMDALAQYEDQGGNLREVLERIARAQRSQSRLHRRIAAQQAGGRLVGLIYGGSPFAFLLFIRFTGGADYGIFYGSPAGQIVQLLLLLSGVATWWLTGKVAQRGIYLADNPATPVLDEDVHRTGLEKATVQVQEYGKVVNALWK